jgi:hypothetical protein
MLLASGVRKTQVTVNDNEDAKSTSWGQSRGQKIPG